jgi:ribosomal protein S18 acetylase RimI-like enzyme
VLTEWGQVVFQFSNTKQGTLARIVIQTADRQYQIAQADRSQWHASLEILWATIEPELRKQKVASTLIEAISHPDLLEGLFVCRFDTDVVGAVLVTQHAGRYAVICKPSFPLTQHSDTYRDCCTSLIQQAANWAHQNGSDLIQCLLEPNELDAKACFENAGFQPFTSIEYLGLDLADHPTAAGLPENREFPDNFELAQIAPQTNRQRWADILSQTYVATLDCAFLHRRRQMSDVIDGYINTGDRGTDDWYILTHKNLDAGCLILAEHSASNQTELVYFGVAPEQRGKGLGKNIVNNAIQIAAENGSSRLVLAVDQANQPAKDIYQRFGFSKWERRIALLKFKHHELMT